MAPLSEWNKAVKTAFKMGRKTNKKYSLKQAMFDAKKIYKKSANSIMNMGRRQSFRSSRKNHKRGRMCRGGGGINEPPSVSADDSQKMIIPDANIHPK